LTIALCLFATAAGAQEIDLTTTPETRKAIEEAVKAMGERKPPPLTDAELRFFQRRYCIYGGWPRSRGQLPRDLTRAECKREFALTRRIFREATPTSNLGISVTQCSDYCKTLYPKLPGY
jgi:hypothetical protein